MRRFVIALAAVLGLASATAMAPSGASAMTAGTQAGVLAAIEDTSLVEDIRWVCRHRYYSSRRVCWWQPPRHHRYRHHHRRWRRW